jgi:hypothetical protein
LHPFSYVHTDVNFLDLFHYSRIWYYDPSKCKLHLSDTTFWPKNDVEPAITNQTSCKDGWLDGWKSWYLKNGQDCAQNMTIGNFPPQILEAYKWYQTGAHQATGKNDCPITSNGAFCADWRSNNTSWYDTEDCSDFLYQSIFDREKWMDFVISLAKLKTGHIRFDSSDFVVTSPGNNGSSCITQLELVISIHHKTTALYVSVFRS